MRAVKRSARDSQDGYTTVDPAKDLTVEVVKTWADAIWDRQVEATVMSAAWVRAKGRNESRGPTAQACGAAGAYVAALKQVGRTSQAYNVVVARQGHPLRLDTVDPKTVLRHLDDD